MATTTMHFGPEWMRKTPSSRPLQPDSPLNPPSAIAHNNPNVTPLSGSSTYSALVTPNTAPLPENRDVAHPFRYSKEEMFRIYKEGGGRGGLGLEVERWEGIVRETSADPVGLKDPGEAEKKLFMGSLNSEMRRRQSTDYLAPLSTSGLDRQKLPGSSTGTSPMRERFGALMGTRRRDSSDQVSAAIPRKLSTSSLQATLNSPRETGLPSPRIRTGPGFDGVLGASEPWTSKRRGSESKSTAPNIRDTANGHVEKSLNIKEEAEVVTKADTGDGLGALEHASAPLDPQLSTNPTLQQYQAGHASIPNQFIDNTSPIATSGSNATMALAEEPTKNPSLTDNTDLASIEWSYLDVQGQVQGPFRADLMQVWHDQGYFTPDLLMKRTILDAEWVSMAELQLRATGPKMFLSPIIPPQLSGPPGLSRRQDDSFSQQSFGAHQPAPGRPFRTNSYINGASVHSESPSSSFGAGRFGNNSPDPASFGGRAGGTVFGDVSLANNRRSTFGDGSVDVAGPRSPFTNGPARSTSYDNYGPNDTLDNGPGASFNKPSFIRNPHDQHSNSSSPFLAQATINNAGIGNSFPNPQAYPLQGAAQQPYTGSQPAHYAQNPLLANLGQPASPLVPATQNPYAASAASQSPWGTPDPSGIKRPGPFDAPHPTARNTTVVRQPSPWERTSRAPWISSQPESPAEAWADPEHSLTVSNLEQHNQQQHKPEASVLDAEGEVENLEPDPKTTEEPPAETAPAPAVPVVEEAPIIETPAPTKPRRKTPLVVKPLESPQPTIITPKTPTPPLPSPAPQVKAAWSKEEESKSAKPSGVAIGFREIQEAEAKKAEARKAAERERERVARATVVTPSEDSPSFTASWGLPTSQVGRTNSGKDVSAGNSPNTATATTQPVWTSVAKAPATKKTMKEIQEEEERRKKLEAAKEKETIGAAARRAHAETINKPASAPPGPAWTTVGSSGKVAVAAATAAAPTRPAVVTSSSTLNVAPPPTAARAGNVSPRPATAPKPPVATPRTEDAPANPSHEFLRWLGDSLKGLNSSVNLEDMSSMLLSFPLDADSSTLEIISDLIYASSTTLDGRRFASEFVAKRKADAASRPKGTAPAGLPGKPPSIADVVKAQPKPAQNEWGGFKVVNKKKKGGKV